MAESENNSTSAGLTFLAAVLILLIIAALTFGISAFVFNDGLFAIASGICLSSILYGCIKILN